MNEQVSEDRGDYTRTDENNQVDARQQAQLPAVRERLMGGASVTAIVPRTFEDVQRIANVAVRSGLLSRDMNQSLEKAIYVIMFGLEIGLKPMAALQRIAIINGRPCVWGDAVPAIAIDTGQVVEFEEFFIGEGETLTAVCKIARKMGNIFLKRETTFSVADARQANLWDDRVRVKRRNRQTNEQYEVDNDSPWHRFPKRMLQMRARVGIRDLFSDALCGLYIAEELVGRDTDAEMRDITPSNGNYERIANPLGASDVVEHDDTSNEAAKINEATGAAGKAADAAQTQTAASQLSQQNDAGQQAAGASEEKKTTRKRTRAVGGAAGEAQQAPTGPAAEESGSDSAPPRPSEADAVSKPDATTNEVFPQPYARQSQSDYIDYAKRWILASTNQVETRARWDKERVIRNNLSGTIAPADIEALLILLRKVGA